MQDFTIFRALGVAFRCWGRNLVSITLLVAVLLAYPLYVVISLDTSSPDAFFEELVGFLRYGTYIIMAMFAMLPAFLIYKVVQDLNGARVSIVNSVLYGLRALPTLIVLAILDRIAEILPSPIDTIVKVVLLTLFFVAAPAAVAERMINPFGAMSRSLFLTSGRRWGTFGLIALIGITMYIASRIFVESMITSPDDLGRIKTMGLVFLCGFALFQTFTGIVQAVSYALLRQDKEGVTNDELAKIFE